MKINRLTLGVITSAATLTAAGMMIAPAAFASSTNVNALPANCNIASLTPVNGIVIANGKASATVNVSADCQPVTLSLVSYSAPDALGYGTSLEAQQLYDFQELNSDTARATENFSNVNVPNGCYQLDLVVGEKINSFATGETYGAENRLIASVNQCETTATTVTTTATPTPSVTPTPSATPVVAGMGSGTTTVTPAVTVLPQTGAGLGGISLAGSFAGLSGLGVAIRQRLRRA